MPTNEEDINKKLLLVKQLLNHTYDILKLFKPLMEEMLKIEEAKKGKNIMMYEKAGYLFGEISHICKEIETVSIPSKTLLEKLGH